MTAIKILVLLFLTVAVQRTDGQCTFPSALVGTWTSSRWGDIVFTSTQFTVTGLTDIGTVTFVCEQVIDSTYIMRSITTITVITNQVDILTCLDLHSISSNSFYYYHGTSEIPLISGATEPVVLMAPSSSLVVSTICNEPTPYTTGTNHMLVKTGSELTAAIQCPDVMLATFDNYTIDLGGGPQCNNNGYITVCDDHSSVTIDYSVCATTVFYSGAGSLACLYSSESGSINYVNLYNFDPTVDDSTTYRFTCVAIMYGPGGSDDYIYATQHPLACASGQTPTSVTSGGTLELSANLRSYTSSSSESMIGVIIAVVVILLLLIILIALAVYHLWYRKRWPLVRSKLPCFKGTGQVDPQITPTSPETPEDGEDAKSSKAPADSSRPASAAQPTTVVPTAVTETKETTEMNRLRYTESTQSVATPSKLQTDMAESVTSTGHAEDAAILSDDDGQHAPRRLPPLDTNRTGEHYYESIDPVECGDGGGVQSGMLGPVYLHQQQLQQHRVAPVESARFSEESEWSDSVSTPPRLPAIDENFPIYQNM